jgi:hypothetical protein
MKFLILTSILAISCIKVPNSKTDAYFKLKKYFKNDQIYQEVMTPEGQIVPVYSPLIVPFVVKKLGAIDLLALEDLLAESLEIKLTERGFAKAAERFLPEGMNDETNYDAVWVRDSGWIFFHFVEFGQKEKARQLILALWDYYATEDQRERFMEIFKNPKLALEGTMNVPHIRFNGNSADLADVTVEGKAEHWNHRQNDAHGIFLVALAQALDLKIISKEDLSKPRLEVLNFFPRFFDIINYENYPDAGAWEEISKINTSSVAMVVRAMEDWLALLKSVEFKNWGINWNESQVKQLIKRGYTRIDKNLQAGGESTSHAPDSLEFRKADAALFNLFLPVPLKQLTLAQKKLALTIMEKLIRPQGVLRYEYDSYQAGNYWIEAPGSDTKNGGPTATGDASGLEDFKLRFSKFVSGSEAQWFFDSKLAMINHQMGFETSSTHESHIYRQQAFVHLKRALGQVTGHKADQIILAADGNEVKALQIPESINTIIIDGKRYYLASPITPLNWAKASLAMALRRLQN